MQTAEKMPLFVDVAHCKFDAPVSEPKIRRLVKSGAVRGVHLDRRLLIDRASWETYLANLPSASKQVA